jgi:hypothetical protein
MFISRFIVFAPPTRISSGLGARKIDADPDKRPRKSPTLHAERGCRSMNQVIKCKVTECRYWAQGNNCELKEIWVERKPLTAGGGLISSVTGGGGVHEQDTFCASFDAK